MRAYLIKENTSSQYPGGHDKFKFTLGLLFVMFTGNIPSSVGHRSNYLTLATRLIMCSQVDMMTQGDSLYDIIDKRDHSNVQSQLLQPDYTPSAGERRTFFCRMNVSRSFRRQAGFGEHKVNVTFTWSSLKKGPQ